MVTWVLERNVFSDDHEALASAVADAGGSVVAWRDEWWQDGRWPRTDGAVVFHGALENADRIARELPWSPGAFCSTDAFACSRWWPQVDDYLLAPRYAFTTVGELVDQGPPSDFGTSVFVRPDSPLKPFSGRVLEGDRITLASLDHGFYYDDESLPVVVAPAVPVHAEWRLVVANGEVVAGSDYVSEGRRAGSPLTSDHAAWQYAAGLVREVAAPDPVYVLDVCLGDSGMRLLELNPFSGADLYGCDRLAVVRAVHALLG